VSGGRTALSNVIVGYGHLTGDPTSELVTVGTAVRAGQIIGTSGWPLFVREDGSRIVQGNDPHLHLEVHLVTDGRRELGRAYPFNPLLFWSPRVVALHARLSALAGTPPYPPSGQPFGRLGFFTLGCFSLDPPDPVWNYEPSRGALWPEGVYDLNQTLEWLRTFAPFTRVADLD
jgi:hypothetical protein